MAMYAGFFRRLHTSAVPEVREMAYHCLTDLRTNTARNIHWICEELELEVASVTPAAVKAAYPTLPLLPDDEWKLEVLEQALLECHCFCASVPLCHRAIVTLEPLYSHLDTRPHSALGCSSYISHPSPSADLSTPDLFNLYLLLICFTSTTLGGPAPPNLHMSMARRTGQQQTSSLAPPKFHIYRCLRTAAHQFN
jgi:hypothetical protein